MDNKIKLFETVLGIHEKGAASLTSSERSLIEQETRALLNAASRKQAMKAPEGFDSFLKELQTAENADEAYSMILKFIKTEDGIEEHEEHEGKEEKEEEALEDLEEDVKELGELEESEEKEKPDMPMGKDEGDKEPDMPKGKDEGDKKPDMPMGKDEGDKKPDMPKGDGKDKDLSESKKELMAKIKKAEDEKKKDEDKKEEKEDKEEKKEEEKEKKESSHLIPKLPATAEKVKVKVTAQRNLLAYFDGKPLFYATPNHATKNDADALRRLANKVYGWLVYEGVDYAVKKCGAKLLAGVDSDIETNFDKDVSEANEGVIEMGEDVVKDPKETPEEDVRNEAEFDTQETPKKVEAGADDDVVVVTEEKPEPTPSAVTEDAEDVIEESEDKPANDVRDKAEVDFQSVEANLKELYKARAAKEVKKANQAFITRFIKAFKVASKRMALNYDDNPYKAASYEVLVDAGLDEDIARELTEEISVVGHDVFTSHMLEKTASLMKKSDEYLNDIESDLNNVAGKPVQVKATKKASSNVRDLRKTASEGNFALTNMGTPSPRSSNQNLVGGIRAAVGGTAINQRVNRLQGQR